MADLVISSGYMLMGLAYGFKESNWRGYINDRITSIQETEHETPTQILFSESAGVKPDPKLDKTRDMLRELFQKCLKMHTVNG